MRWLLTLAYLLTPMLLVGGGLTLGVVAVQEPSLTVTSPQQGESIESNTVTVAFEASDFNIVPSSVPLEQAGMHPEVNQPGEGHLHLMLDLRPVVVWDQSEPFTFTDVEPGQHELTVELANNDHSSLSPPVVQQISFRVTMPDALPTAGSERHPFAARFFFTGLLLLGAAGFISHRTRYLAHRRRQEEV